MPVVALEVISRLLAASSSSGDKFGSLCAAVWPCASGPLGPAGPPFMLGLLAPLPIPFGIWPDCWATIAVTLTRMGRSSTITSDCKWGSASLCDGGAVSVPSAIQTSEPSQRDSHRIARQLAVSERLFLTAFLDTARGPHGRQVDPSAMSLWACLQP